MTTPRAVDAPNLQPKPPDRAAVRDLSITDVSRAVSSHIFGNYVFVQTQPCLKGASSEHVC
jgi:hypothetical protein